tara:strand:- start:2208 stop:3074 length:867 start_codon:yes stop_codon:yes gene_type:complete
MNKATNIIDVDELQFNEKVIEGSKEKLIIVDFWAPWCGPCKQLTPVLEKIIKKYPEKINLIKINIDENQQIASQLRIQSIPAVFAFKDKQIVNAFQGVLPEKQIIDFLEKCLGSKLNEDFEDFYDQINKKMSEKDFENIKDVLLEFISNQPEEVKAISLYLECLIELKQFDELETFLESLEEEILKKNEIKQIIKKTEILKNNVSGPDIESLLIKLEEKPDDINLVLEIADKYFSMQDYENSMSLLLKFYPKNKEKIKKKMLEFFEVLGNSNEHTVNYRKKLSQIMFS